MRSRCTANYIHTDLHGIPDFGVPYYRPADGPADLRTTPTAGGPFPEFGVNRNNFYGFVNRDFQSLQAGHRHVKRRSAGDAGSTLSPTSSRAQHSMLGLHRHAAGSAA